MTNRKRERDPDPPDMRDELHDLDWLTPDVEGDCRTCSGEGGVACGACGGDGCGRCLDGEWSCPECGGSGFNEDDHSWMDEE